MMIFVYFSVSKAMISLSSRLEKAKIVCWRIMYHYRIHSNLLMRRFHKSLRKSLCWFNASFCVCEWQVETECFSFSEVFCLEKFFRSKFWLKSFCWIFFLKSQLVLDVFLVPSNFVLSRWCLQKNISKKCVENHLLVNLLRRWLS